MFNVFADTSALAAVKNPNDPSHLLALNVLEKLKSADLTFYTSSYILAELMNIVCRDVGKQAAIEMLGEVRSGNYAIITPNDTLIFKSESLFRGIKSKNVSYTDCVSFSIMREFSIKWAFSFDLHFKKQGFKRLGVDGWPK
jgi:predicted nucleic acid-binding protein